MAAPIYSQGDYRSALQALFPRGRVWPRDPDATQSALLGGLARSFARTNGDAAALLVDAFPSTTAELLPEWESSLGLPDPCAGQQPTVQARRAQVLATLRQSFSGPSIPNLVALAESLGYSITITQFSPSRFGRVFGNPFGGIAWANAWQVNVANFTIQKFKFGSDAFGENFSSWGSTVLQCELAAVAPAHTVLNFFYYSNAVLGSGTLPMMLGLGS